LPATCYFVSGLQKLPVKIDQIGGFHKFYH
jgi:hypothetical protein